METLFVMATTFFLYTATPVTHEFQRDYPDSVSCQNAAAQISSGQYDQVEIKPIKGSNTVYITTCVPVTAD